MKYIGYWIFTGFFLSPLMAQLRWETTVIDANAVDAARVDTYAPLLEKATPSIVSIFPAMLLDGEEQADPLQRFFIPREPGAKQNEEKGAPRELIRGSGSGVIVTADGYIVTNRHVIMLPNGKPADVVKVELHDKRSVSAVLVGMDTLTDLALLKVEAKDLRALPVAEKDEVKTGDLVFAIGNPFRLGITATMGMVSATRRCTSDNPETVENYIQTDAAINPGNSGGALINARGQLIGINTAIYGASTNAGIGFAIPSRLMKHVVEVLAAKGKVTRGFIGIQSGSFPANDQVPPKGALVVNLMEDSPAAASGIAVGDLITAIDNEAVRDKNELRLLLSMLRPDQVTRISITRGGNASVIEVKASEPALHDGRSNFIAVDLLPGAVLAQGKRGVIVHKIPDDLARSTKLEAEMEILSINDNDIIKVDDVTAHLRSGINKVKIAAGDSTRTLSVRIP
jgi:S1-C subfamily serine protease